MRHRTIRGKIIYISDDIGEEGREYFTITVQPNGARTLRAHCEMDNDSLIRDVTYSLDSNWLPEEAFVRLTINEQFQGSAWFQFSKKRVQCESLTREAGRMTQLVNITEHPPSFGGHPICCDTWHSKKGDLLRGDKNIGELRGIPMSSPLPNGGSGPSLSFTNVDVEFLDEEDLTTPAGEFSTRHFYNHSLRRGFKRQPVEIWATGDDFIPVRARWELLKQTYELVELSEDDPQKK